MDLLHVGEQTEMSSCVLFDRCCVVFGPLMSQSLPFVAPFVRPVDCPESTWGTSRASAVLLVKCLTGRSFGVSSDLQRARVGELLCPLLAFERQRDKSSSSCYIIQVSCDA